MSARSDAGGGMVGRALARELSHAVADVSSAEARVWEARKAHAARAASRLSQVMDRVHAAKKRPTRWVTLPRQVRAAMRAQGDGLSARRVKPRYRKYADSGRLEPVSGSSPALVLDVSSVPSGVVTHRDGQVLLTGTESGLLVSFTAEDTSARYVPLNRPAPIGDLFPPGTTVALRFDAAISATGGFGVNVSWTDAQGTRIPGTTYFGSGIEHYVVVPRRATGIYLFLTLQGDGAALLREVQVSEKLAAVLGGSTSDGSVATVSAALAASSSANVLAAPVRFSVVVPFFNVESYLDQLIESLRSQELGPYELEVLFVDDGSTDSSPDRVRDAFRDGVLRGDIIGHLIQQSNRGTSAAKNAALDLATGDYVTFVDGDDVVEQTYFKDAAEFLLASPIELPLVDMKIARWDEGRPLDSAETMLAHKYADGSRIVDLSAEPNVIKTHAASSFFSRAQLEAAGTRFPTGIHASEDMLFCAGFIASLASPLLGAVDGGRYFYRRREASAGQLSNAVWENPEWLVNKLGAGYMPLMRRAARHTGQVPDWLASVILYDYRWLLERLNGPGAGDWPNELRDTLQSLVIAGLQLISHEAIDAYAAAPLPDELRRLMHELKDE